MPLRSVRKPHCRELLLELREHDFAYDGCEAIQLQHEIRYRPGRRKIERQQWSRLYLCYGASCRPSRSAGNESYIDCVAVGCGASRVGLYLLSTHALSHCADPSA